MKQTKHLELSDYTNIWSVILLLLLATSLDGYDLQGSDSSKPQKMKALLNAIETYNESAFNPEIMSTLHLVENSGFVVNILKSISSERNSKKESSTSTFQSSLMYIQREFEAAFSKIKLNKNKILFIDGIDIRPGNIPYDQYLDCIKGLANATWNLNTDFFSNIRDSKGRLRVVLLLRPDIFSSIGLQNLTNKVRDNSVYLDWRTTYPDHRTSPLFELADNLLRCQQNGKMNKGEAWDAYFPWTSHSTNPTREADPPFNHFLRLTYSRPRDVVTLLDLLQTIQREKKKETDIFLNLFGDYELRNRYSDYLLGGIKDQLSFYYTESDYETFLKFFNYLHGQKEFSYEEYLNIYTAYKDVVDEENEGTPKFISSPTEFLQFLYDTNIICSIEYDGCEPFFSWCYRERGPSKISPKVTVGVYYKIHDGLQKALGVGRVLRGKGYKERY